MPERTLDPAARYETRALLAGAYLPGCLDVTLTHVLDTWQNRFICNGPKAASAADAGADDTNGRATCSTCSSRDPRTRGQS